MGWKAPKWSPPKINASAIEDKYNRGLEKPGAKALDTTFSDQLWKDPRDVLGAWGDVGQGATAEGINAALGDTTTAYVADHQREAWLAAALALGGAGAIQVGMTGGAWGGIGTAAGVGAALAGEALTKNRVDEARAQSRDQSKQDNPPDVNEANDPRMAEQFQRLRKAARGLGRAGTIKFKGAANLGGTDSLGDALALQGA
jgi:hypothetical protein